MVLSSMALGAVLGSFATVILIAIFIVCKKSSKETYFERHCQYCEIFLNEDSDTSICFSCKKNKK